MRALHALTIACGAFLFTHWFNPLSAYTLDYLASRGIPTAASVAYILPVFVYAIAPATVFAGCVFEFFGGAAALATASVANVASAALVAFAHDRTSLDISSGLFALAFSSLFVVSACIAAGVPASEYQRATSISRCCLLLGTVISALLGQALNATGVLPTAAYIAVASSCTATAILIGAARVGAFRTLPRGGCFVASRLVSAVDLHAHYAPSNGEPLLAADASGEHVLATDVPGFVAEVFPAAHAAATRAGGGGAQVSSVITDYPLESPGPPPASAAGVPSAVTFPRSALRSPPFLFLGALLASTLAIHTLVLTYWQAVVTLGGGVGGDDASDNGAILAAAYAAAALLAAAPAARRIDAALRASALTAAAAALALAAAALLGMGCAADLPRGVAAALFVLYHAVAEAILVVVYAR